MRKAVATAAECTGDDVLYLALTQSGSTVTGKSCEEYERDCNDLQSGTLAGFTFFYTFGSDRVDADLSLGGDTLDGSLRSTKAPGMTVPRTFP